MTHPTATPSAERHGTVPVDDAKNIEIMTIQSING